MWFTVCLHGIGMYMMTDCMHTFFPLTRTACGGIGVGIIHMAPAGDSVGDGVRRGTTIAGTIPVIGVAATGVAIGDIITIIINRIIIGMRQEDVLPMQAIIEEVVGEAVVRPIVPVRVIAITDPLLR